MSSLGVARKSALDGRGARQETIAIALVWRMGAPMPGDLGDAEWAIEVENPSCSPKFSG